MDPEARRSACAAFRAKLSRDTGENLTPAECEELLSFTFVEGGEEVSVQTNPGLFYVRLGEAIVGRCLAHALPDRKMVACWCYREAAEVHMHPEGMRILGTCLFRRGHGVTEDPVQAAVWFQKAADLGDADSKAKLGGFLVVGEPRAGVAKDAARGFGLLREAFVRSGLWSGAISRGTVLLAR